MQILQKYKGAFTILGFIFLALGLLSIILNMVGLDFSFMRFMDQLGPLGAFILKLFMTLSGFVIIALARTDWERLERETE